jgi:hypothetical protein
MPSKQSVNLKLRALQKIHNAIELVVQDIMQEAKEITEEKSTAKLLERLDKIQKHSSKLRNLLDEEAFYGSI